MSVRQKTKVDVDFSKLTPEEQIQYSLNKRLYSEVSVNEFLGGDAKKRFDLFRAENVQ